MGHGQGALNSVDWIADLKLLMVLQTWKNATWPCFNHRSSHTLGPSVYSSGFLSFFLSFFFFCFKPTLAPH